MRNKILLTTGVAIIAVCAAIVLVTADGQVRYSADHGDTVPFWFRWIPALAGILLIRLLPAPSAGAATSTSRTGALVLAAAAVLFAVGATMLGPQEPWLTLLKLALLLAVPLVLLRRRGLPAPGPGASWIPALPVAAWLLLAHAGPFAIPATPFDLDPATLIVTLIVVFAVNAVLEEFFYRRWLQTRWESLIGPWPAILLASLLWAVWHVAIQGGDLAVVIVSHSVTGIFLGYLWTRYRRMWPLLVVHGALNALPSLLAML